MKPVQPCPPSNELLVWSSSGHLRRAFTMRVTCMQLDWYIIPSRLPPNFTHWAALKLCTALQNFYKFLVKPENLCTCASPEVTHSFKHTPTLWHYIFSVATKSTVCLQQRGRTEILTFWLCRDSRQQAAYASALEPKMSHKQLKQINTSPSCWKVPRKTCTSSL